MVISLIKTEAELRTAFPVLQELREALEWSKFLEVYTHSQAQDQYQIAGIQEQGRWIALIGYRILWDFVHFKHLYVDDLVVTASERSRGLGAKLLRFAEAEACAQGCALVRLSTGVQNTSGMRFYEREGMALRSVTYKKKVQ